MPYTFSDDYRYKKLTLRSIENLRGLQIPISDKDFRRKYKNIVVIDENDPRPMREQLIEIFGEGPEPVFRNPEFDDKK